MTATIETALDVDAARRILLDAQEALGEARRAHRAAREDLKAYEGAEQFSKMADAQAVVEAARADALACEERVAAAQAAFDEAVAARRAEAQDQYAKIVLDLTAAVELALGLVDVETAFRKRPGTGLTYPDLAKPLPTVALKDWLNGARRRFS